MMNLDSFETILEQVDATVITDSLQEYLTENRKQRIEEVIPARLNSIHLAVESPSDIHNALAAVRSAEAFGVLNIHIIAPEGEAKGIRPVTQGAFHWVNIYYYDSLPQFLSVIKDQSLQLAGGVVDASFQLDQVPIEKPLCLLIGNEQKGLTPEAKQNCDITYKIPMVGMSESFNLSVSAAISLYDTTARKRALLQQPGDLTPDQQKLTRAQYYMNSVDSRLIENLFRHHIGTTTLR